MFYVEPCYSSHLQYRPQKYGHINRGCISLNHLSPKCITDLLRLTPDDFTWEKRDPLGLKGLKGLFE